MAHTEEKLESQTIYQGRIIAVTQDTVRLENGKNAKREVVHHHGGAAIVPVGENGEVYLVRQYRYPMGRELLEIPAGKLDAPGEPGIECARRELEEETGYRAENIEWLMDLRTTVAFCDEKVEIFLARDLKPAKQHLDENEFIQVKAYTLEELREMIFTGEIEDSKTIASILAYESKYCH